MSAADWPPGPEPREAPLPLRHRMPSAPPPTQATWPLTLVLDDPDVRRERWAAGLTDVAAGAVAVPVWPRAERNALFADLLEALAHLDGSVTGGRLPGWRVAGAWLLAERISDLVVTHTQWLSLHELDVLLRLSTAAGARLWLTGQLPFAPEVTERIEEYLPPTAALTWAGFEQAWRRRPPRSTSCGAAVADQRRPAARRLPAGQGQLLDVDPLLLDPALSGVHAAVRTAAQAELDLGAAVVRAELAPVLAAATWRTSRRAGALNVEQLVTDRLAWGCLRAPTAEQALLRAAGAARELLACGVHVQLDRTGVRAGHAAAASRHQQPLGDVLAGVHDPVSAAAAALVDAGVPAWRLPDLLGVDVTDGPDGQVTVRTPDRTYAVTGLAATAVRAQRAARWLADASPGTALFPLAPTPDGQRRACALAAGMLSVRTGVPLGPHALLGCDGAGHAHRCVGPWTVRPLRTAEPAVLAALQDRTAPPAVADRAEPSGGAAQRLAAAVGGTPAPSLSSEQALVLLAAAVGPLPVGITRGGLRSAVPPLRLVGLLRRDADRITLGGAAPASALRRLAAHARVGPPPTAPRVRR